MLLILLANFAFPDDLVVKDDSGNLYVLHDDLTWETIDSINYDFDFSSIKEDTIPIFLRGGIFCKRELLIVATEMYLQGWKYTMPYPKSNQAAWGNYDGRTTWWYGYWYNWITKKYSSETPIKKLNGKYFGNEVDLTDVYHYGGCPRFPNELEWLLSEEGGVNPK